MPNAQRTVATAKGQVASEREETKVTGKVVEKVGIQKAMEDTGRVQDPTKAKEKMQRAKANTKALRTQ